jgi:trk system potassium uptake protein TrkA
MQFEQNTSQIRYLQVNNTSIFKNKTLKNLKNKINDEFLIAAILQDEQLIIPKGDTKIRENNILFIVSNKDDKHFFKDDIKKILIIGGGKLAKILCEKLLGLKYSISLIEKDYERSKYIAEIFLGASTDTCDAEGKITKVHHTLPPRVTKRGATALNAG